MSCKSYQLTAVEFRIIYRDRSHTIGNGYREIRRGRCRPGNFTVSIIHIIYIIIQIDRSKTAALCYTAVGDITNYRRIVYRCNGKGCIITIR